MIIDTGSSCLTLPAEIYGSFYSWWNKSYAVNNINNLPSFKFTLADIDHSDSSDLSSGKFYIRLSDLVVDASAINMEKGALNLGGHKKLCVLQGDSIQSYIGDSTYNTPLISIGALALRSFYFAANMSKGSIGLANKLTAEDVSNAEYLTSSSGYCLKPTQCRGKQFYVKSYNTCNSPSCSQYFFLYLDEDTQICFYNMTFINAGIIVIIILAIIESITYFVLQYTATEGK